MVFTCKSICKIHKNVKKVNYSLGINVFCSICDKTFLKENNDGIFCKCCNVRLRHTARTHKNLK